MSAEHPPVGAAADSAGAAPAPYVAFAVERRGAIANFVDKHGRASVEELARLLNVSGETVRRDLSVLASEGAVKRVHGGAVRPVLIDEVPIWARVSVHAEEKKRIARAALEHLPAKGVVLIEAGDTLTHLATALPQECALTVVTNACYMATILLKKPKVTVLMTGGRLRRETLAGVDHWALQALRDTNVDVAFLGTNGVSVKRGLTTPDPAEAAVKRAMLETGLKRVLLADNSKVGAVAMCRYGDIGDVDLLVTDSGVSAEAAEELRAAGVGVVRA